jgi:hypothetical protein
MRPAAEVVCEMDHSRIAVVVGPRQTWGTPVDKDSG